MARFLVDPINVEEFVSKFRDSKQPLLDGCTLVAFAHTQTHWHAIFQNDECSMDFSGNVSVTRDWMVKRG